MHSDMSTNDHAKVSDSGYANTYDNSQSQRSSGSSLSRNSNRLESSGYCGGHPSTSGFGNEALPRPISKKKEKEHKTKKSKNLTSMEYKHMESVDNNTNQLKDSGIYNHVSSHLEQALKKSEEVGRVELMDATKPSEHNDDTKATVYDEGIDSLTNPLDNTNAEFYTMISLRDGLVLHSTDSLQKLLGFPKDYWLGKSFIDFLHPDDQTVFADKLSNRYLGDNHEKEMSLRLTHVFCRLQEYSTRANVEKNGIIPMYIPFHLTLGLKNFPKYNIDEEKSAMLCLIIIAKEVVSAYKAPEETIISPVFTTRHTATCHFSHVDDDVVRYFGYLPQNMIGHSLFDYYHPEDLPFMKDVYETVVKLKDSSFRSKPYRFAVNNGGYVVLETEWSSFINPWKGKLEFVIGQHRVLRGPVNPDVFQQPDDKYQNFLDNISEEVLKESQIIQNEIRSLLEERIQKSSIPDTPTKLTKNSKEILSFVESVINEMRGSKLTAKVPSIAADDKSFSEHDSVMVVGISPHHDYCDSKSSSETPPSYNQLNYNEKIDRFFGSKPLGNAVYGSDEENINSSVHTRDESGKTSSNEIPTKHTPNHDSGGGSGSGENLSSESNNQMSSDSRDDSLKGNVNSGGFESSQLPVLTEKLLNQHNHEMEKLMILKHKERRSSIKSNKIIEDNNRMKAKEQLNDERKAMGKIRGTKRTSTNHNREDELLKTLKLDEKINYRHLEKNKMTVNRMIIDQPQTHTNIWRELNAVPPTLSHTQQYIATSASLQCPTPFSQMVPIYYAPIARIQDYITNNTSVQSLNNQQLHMPQHFWPHPYGTIYPPVIANSSSAPIVYTPQMILQVPTALKEYPRAAAAAMSPPVLRDEPVQRKRPASQATSIKAEPGSITAMSDSFKKPQSSGGRISSCISIDGGNSSLIDLQNSINVPQNPQLASSTEDSSDSSFYGSFLNTSSGSSCNPILLESLHQNVKTERYNNTFQSSRCGGNFAMINELKANCELKKATLHIPSELYHGYLNRDVLNLQHSLEKVEAPWMQGINMTPEIIYQYQIQPKSLDEVLRNDLKILNANPQSQLINDQLDQLYLDLELEGFGRKLNLEENDHSSESDRTNSTEDRPDISPQV